jgi:hypothetical protein
MQKNSVLIANISNSHYYRTNFTKCGVFPRELTNKIDYLVSRTAKIYYCSTVRECQHTCGQNGKYYEKKHQITDYIKIKNP